MAETDKKRELILEGAIKRFTHFGIHKTTMNEIAEDLSVSKPSLYYYFPDKLSLIMGVVGRIFEDYFNMLEKEPKQYDNIASTLLHCIEVKHRFFQKYYMLHLSNGNTDSSLNSAELKACLSEKFTQNRLFHEKIFEKAIAAGEIQSQEDLSKIADLYLSIQAGLSSLCIMHGNRELIPDKKELRIMKEKQIMFSKIFIKGLQ